MLKDADLDAIADYSLALPAVDNKIPQAIEAGTPITERFVRIGVYLFIPEQTPH